MENWYSFCNFVFQILATLIYPHTFEQKTGFTTVRERISKLCTSEAGRRAVDEMHFMTDFNAIDASLRAVDEMLAATTSDIGFSLGSVPELGEALARAKAEGAF
ncbi:hypothetical protein K0B41_24120, partial [Salmonella enterica subsp. enterica serovar Mbandaka]|nr:hypothetical protein [Salmonella enterica subsp. enterica serovar Mbandaka]